MTLCTTENLDVTNAQNFKLVFPILPVSTDLNDNKNLTLNIFSTVLPSVTLNTEERGWQGGKIQAATGKLTFEPWNVSFVVDSLFANWILLFKWLTYINDGHAKWAELDNNYMVDASFQALNNWGTRVFEVMFHNVWITSLGEVQFSYREGSALIECQASFVYSHYELRE